MSTIHELSNSAIGALRNLPAEQAARQPADRPRPASPGAPDSLELSDAARRFADEAPIRSELVGQVRAQLARGEYLTDEKLDAALDRLIDDVLS